MKKIKILFDIVGNTKWVGGLYYLRNIIFGIGANLRIRNKCQPVVVCSSEIEYLFAPFSDFAELIIYDRDDRKGRFKCLVNAILRSDYVYNYHQYKFDPFNLLKRKG